MLENQVTVPDLGLILCKSRIYYPKLENSESEAKVLEPIKNIFLASDDPQEDLKVRFKNKEKLVFKKAYGFYRDPNNQLLWMHLASYSYLSGSITLEEYRVFTDIYDPFRPREKFGEFYFNRGGFRDVVA